MKILKRRSSSRGVVPLSLALLAVSGSSAAFAAGETQPSDANSSCQREMRRFAVWPHSSPKAAPMARFEHREVTVCNGKIVAQPKREELADAPGQP